MHAAELVLWPEEAFNDELFPGILYQKLGLKNDGSTYVRILKRSIDARARKVCIRFQVNVIPAGEKGPTIQYRIPEISVRNSTRRVIVVGSGPAGLFAALRLIELGIKPVVLERGNDVQLRRRDLAAINKDQIVNPESNYCFGEGGAGTYSDGKLYTRSKKRGDVNRILEILVAHGAKEEILYDAHPHIGTNKLPKLIEQIRNRIIDLGGEVHFGSKVTDLILDGDIIKNVEVNFTDAYQADAVVLATGHSARDIFELLHRKKIAIEAKPYALGVRVEHQQALIDRIQYHCPVDRGQFLPASSYSLVHQATIQGNERGVFSFCMCPGGFIVPAATSPGEVVVNGMSPSRRDSKFANSGIVVAIEAHDFKAYHQHGPLAGMYFQAAIEKRACDIAGGTQHAPAQRLLDFVSNKVSPSLLETSYQPGLTSVDMRDVLPEFVFSALQQGFKNFGSKMKGYLTNDAQIVGVESRTSSPIKIPRDNDTLRHPEVANLFPCGEGAGYAGGIVSAAMDGERVAEAVRNLTFA